MTRRSAARFRRPIRALLVLAVLAALVPAATPAGASSPAVANGLVYAGLGAWRLSDGAERWRFGTIDYGDPVVSGGRLYVTGIADVNGQQVAVDDQFAPGAAVAGAVR